MFRCDMILIIYLISIKISDDANVEMMYEDNVIFHATEGLGKRTVAQFDEFSATLSWETTSSGAKFIAPVVRGMAYATVVYTKLTPQLTFVNMVSVNGMTRGQVSGKFYSNTSTLLFLYASILTTIKQKLQTLTKIIY